MFDSLFGGKSTRQKQLDSQEKQVLDSTTKPHQAVPGDIHNKQDTAKAEAKKKASKSIQDWIESGR